VFPSFSLVWYVIKSCPSTCEIMSVQSTRTWYNMFVHESNTDRSYSSHVNTIIVGFYFKSAMHALPSVVYKYKEDNEKKIVSRGGGPELLIMYVSKSR
jgi:hypothetical protein